MVICEPPRGQDPCGTRENPVSLRLKWQSPGYALQCIYDMSKQPALMNQLWRQVWPEYLWSDLLADGLSEVWPVTFNNYYGHEETSLPYINVAIEIASDEKLCLPWDWLARCLLYAPAASLTYYLNASGPLALQQQDKEYYVSLHRPAQAYQTQRVMYKTFGADDWLWPLQHTVFEDTWSAEEDADKTCSKFARPFDCLCNAPIYTRPIHRQQVAITGSWCQVLPDADRDLSCVHFGYDMAGMTDGDDIAVEFERLVEVEEAGLCGTQYGVHIAFSEFIPFTCEIARHPDWKQKRQEAKKRAKGKKAKVARRRSKGEVGMTRVSKASWLCEDMYVRPP